MPAFKSSTGLEILLRRSLISSLLDLNSYSDPCLRIISLLSKWVSNPLTGDSEAWKSHSKLYLQVLPIIIYFSSFISVLYYLGAMQWLIYKISWLMQLSLGTSATESMCAAGWNCFMDRQSITIHHTTHDTFLLYRKYICRADWISLAHTTLLKGFDYLWITCCDDCGIWNDRWKCTRRLFGIRRKCSLYIWKQNLQFLNDLHGFYWAD